MIGIMNNENIFTFIELLFLSYYVKAMQHEHSQLFHVISIDRATKTRSPFRVVTIKSQ